MAIIKKYNKSNGTTYVYESVSYWDKEKQQPRSRRKLIGKVDPLTGAVVPTGGRGRRRKQDSGNTPAMGTPPAGNSIPRRDVSEPGEIPSDYREKYESACRTISEQRSTIAAMKDRIERLSVEKEEFLEKMGQILRDYHNQL